MSAVVTRRLSREFPRRGAAAGTAYALREVSITVEPGEVRGLLGPNGAGKTTLCKILSTVLLPTAGSASVLGHDVVSEPDWARRSIGIVFGGERGLYGRLTARQNLKFWAALYGMTGPTLRRRVGQLLERTGLESRADERVDQFSRGMKQRLHLARGLVADPPVLILDEPTAGMDPIAAREFRTMVRQLRDDSRTLLITTHDMAEAEAVCDRVTLLQHGQVLATESPNAIGDLISERDQITASGVPAAVIAEVSALRDVIVIEAADSELKVETASVTAAQAVLGRLAAADVTRLSKGSPGLEEVYLRLMQDQRMAVD